MSNVQLTFTFNVALQCVSGGSIKPTESPCTRCSAQLIFIPQQSLTLFFADVYNGVKTGSNYYLVGEDLKLNCTLSDDLLKTWKSDNLHFEKRDQSVASGTKTCFPTDHITIIDNSTAALTIQNITVDRENVYFCQAGCYSDCEDCSETVGYTDEIKIQYGPKNVTNVTCFIYNWNDHMNCSWKHPVKYQDYGDTSVSVSNSSTVFCEGKLLENCTWSGDKFTVRDKYAVNITVINTERNVSASQIIIVNRNENVKPAPVTDLKVEELPNSCLLLSWNHTSSEDKVFQVCSPEAQGDFKVLTSNLNRSSYKECNIKPYTLYTFFVRCFPSGAKGYWSDPIFVNITTKLLFRPTVGPKVTNSSYVTFKCVNNSKAIQIYWQKQNPDTNTVINNYLIKKDGKILRNVTADYYTTTIQIECNSNNVWLDILAENAMGQSINPSSMLILQNFTVPAKVKETFSIEWSESLQAVWSHDNSNKTSYILYWCKGYFPAVCENQIDWVVIYYSVTNFSLPRLDDDPTRYLYGISVSNDGHSSEIYWTDCLFKLNPSEIPAPSVEITSTDYSAVIMFSMKKCSYHNPIKITSFFIQYCEELQCNDTNYIMYASSDTSEVSLSLNPATSYYISVQGKIYDKLGEPTKKTFKTKDENVGVRRTWIIAAVLVPLLGFIITLTVACLVRKCHQSRLKTAFYIDNMESENAKASRHIFATKDSMVIKTSLEEPEATSPSQYPSSTTINNASETSYIKMSYFNKNTQDSDQCDQDGTELVVLQDLPKSDTCRENDIQEPSLTTVQPQMSQDKQSEMIENNVEIYPVFADQPVEINKDKQSFVLETSPCNDYVHQIH
ncbi:hypothetical protein Btru_062469 [Bulinus truncatus]|nr:hypothetical protein Btru_062469 [Bulinus truncatus]